MVKPRRGQIQRAIKQQLPGGRTEEIATSDHLGNLHRRIVHDHSKLIRRRVVVSPNHEVAEIAPRDESLMPLAFVVVFNDLSVRDPESPVESLRSR